MSGAGWSDCGTPERLEAAFGGVSSAPQSAVHARLGAGGARAVGA
jgi:hypothetical protein